jgi:fibronectin type III domain protein
VSAVADPNTGVWVYDGGWYIFGGTSVASPIVASVYALAGNASSTSTLASYPYGSTSALNDVTSGSNGSCSGTYLCTAVSGYDGPTGLGTPNGTTAFAPSGPPPAPTAPSAPQNLTATAGNTSVTLSWQPPSSGTVTYYTVHRSSGSDVSVTTTSYTDSGLTNGTTYTYSVTATNSVGTSPASNTATATPAALSAPSAPQNLTATTATSKGVNLTWSAPVSNGGSAVTGYQLWRSTSSGTESFYATVSCTSNTCSVRDASTVRGQTYYYEVRATNSVGTGPASNEAWAKAR